MNNLNQFVMKLGELVRFHRNKAALTQLQLAMLAGVGKTTVYDIEKGKTTVQINSLFAVLSVLNIQIQFSGPLLTAFNEWSSAKAGTAAVQDARI
jgi:HTH-type transcriptional regulator/antitoxin HipB